MAPAPSKPYLKKDNLPPKCGLKGSVARPDSWPMFESVVREYVSAPERNEKQNAHRRGNVRGTMTEFYYEKVVRQRSAGTADAREHLIESCGHRHPTRQEADGCGGPERVAEYQSSGNVLTQVLTRKPKEWSDPAD